MPLAHCLLLPRNVTFFSSPSDPLERAGASAAIQCVVSAIFESEPVRACPVLFIVPRILVDFQLLFQLMRSIGAGPPESTTVIYASASFAFFAFFLFSRLPRDFSFRKVCDARRSDVINALEIKDCRARARGASLTTNTSASSAVVARGRAATDDGTIGVSLIKIFRHNAPPRDFSRIILSRFN